MKAIRTFTEQHARALFTLAGLEVVRVFEITNEYWRENETSGPGFLVRTPYGIVKIGWRKRVLDINWIDTPYRGEITSDDTTKDETCVHAWSYPDAVKYISALQCRLRQVARPTATGAASPEVLPASPVPNVQDPSSVTFTDGGNQQ